MSNLPSLTGCERMFETKDVIVTKTDTTGRILYANRTFLGISQLETDKTIGAPHSLIRHPDMPRCVFKLLWDRLQAGKELFAYVINRATNGDHYWVFAHVTPSLDAKGQIAGYHSSRRVPRRDPIENVIKPLYADLLAEEKRHGDRKQGMNAAFDRMQAILRDKGTDYDSFIFSL